MAHRRRQFFDRPNLDSQTLALESRSFEYIPKAEDDESADIDEPPDASNMFGRVPMASSQADESRCTPTAAQSLLTKALLTSPNLRGVSQIDTSVASAQSTASGQSILSAVSTADLTSDGGLTSPARTTTPSPPLPPTLGTGLPIIPGQDTDKSSKPSTYGIRFAPPLSQPQKAEPPKRHITFACNGPKKNNEEEKKNEVEQPKRKCMLRFDCPSKPARELASKILPAPKPQRIINPLSIATSLSSDAPASRKNSSYSEDSEADGNGDGVKSTASSPEVTRSEGLRFHEFAAGRSEEEGWTMEKPSSRQKITVADTLRKENAIRKLGEEAEAEAQEEEDEEDEAELEEDMDDDLDDDDSNEADEDEEDEEDEEEEDDDGNLTDDEEGFAASDDESDAGSEFEFWTPAITTAATSVEQGEPVRPKQTRTRSESSMESAAGVSTTAIGFSGRGRRLPGRRGSPKMRPGTPELPDSTDFVCGTLDEDRPMEVAYLSCMKQRRIAKQGVHPQDVDPSFPTSDPDDDDDDDDDEEYYAVSGSDSQAWVAGKPDESDDGFHTQRSRANSTRKALLKSPIVSPKRMRSPPPKRRAKSPAPIAAARGHAARSPPPRRLFGRSPHRSHKSPQRSVKSPCATQQNSFKGNAALINDLPGVVDCSRATLTKSLPRTPNPYWTAHRQSRLAALKRAKESRGTVSDTAADEIHTRGPIDIVQGLERKRQRRKEKFWKIHCRNAKDKDKDRRPPPGKGVQRMREVGLEMADRCKGYGQRLQLVLSV